MIGAGDVVILSAKGKSYWVRAGEGDGGDRSWDGRSC
jgi:hypothetical protein